MADEKNSGLSKNQASRINRANRQIVTNIDHLTNNLSVITHGTKRNERIEDLNMQFNNLLTRDITEVNNKSYDNSTSFINNLISETSKRQALSNSQFTAITDLFNSDSDQLESLISNRYRNKMVKRDDLREITNQLVELKAAVKITRDAIISADVIDGHLSRNLTIDKNDSDSESRYQPILEDMEKRLDLQSKIKDFIITRTLEYGEYYVQLTPYSELFKNFTDKREDLMTNSTYRRRGFYESVDESIDFESKLKSDNVGATTLLEFVNSKGSEYKKSVSDYFQESVCSSDYFKEQYNEYEQKNISKNIPKELEELLGNISICNEYVPDQFIEYGYEEFLEYYEYKGKGPSIKNKKLKQPTGIDLGAFKDTKKNSKKNEFSEITDCHISFLDSNKIYPIEMMDEVIGYVKVIDEDIRPVQGTIANSIQLNRGRNSGYSNELIERLTEMIVQSFDKKFLNKNIKFKKIIADALNYYEITQKKLRFQFVPVDYIIPFKINIDEHGMGTSILEGSFYHGRLFATLLLFKIMSIIVYSNDTRINYIKQSGIDKDLINKTQHIAREKQRRSIKGNDLFSYGKIIDKIGQGNEMYLPVGKSNERGIEMEILQGQDIQLNTDLFELLKKSYTAGTPVPQALLNQIHEAEFAKTLELENNKFRGEVVSLQLTLNKQITDLYKRLATYCTNIPESYIDTIVFNFIEPRFSDFNVTNDLLNNHNTVQEFLINIFFGEDQEDKAEEIKIFKRLLAEERLPMIKFDKIEDFFREANIKAQEIKLKKKTEGNSSEEETTDDSGAE